MLENLISEIKLEWILKQTSFNKEVVILIPQYNELSNGSFINRLNYFDNLAKKYVEIIDIIIIDDGSSDNSLDTLITFKNESSIQFSIVSVTPNADKIGALYVTLLNINYKYILFSDFDTDLVHLDFLPETVNNLKKDPSLMGCYFRMIPMFRSSSMINRYQKLEYALQRTWYKFTSRDRSVAVMPGSCSMFKYDVLKSILKTHSGIRNGEDRETTAIGLNLGYSAYYEKRILAITRAPKTLKFLIVQRIRWNLG